MIATDEPKALVIQYKDNSIKEIIDIGYSIPTAAEFDELARLLEKRGLRLTIENITEVLLFEDLKTIASTGGSV